MDTQARNRNKNPLTSQGLKREVVSIGSHPDNDIVISDPQVLPFHLTLDYRQRPYRLYVPDPQADVTIDGRRLTGEPSAEVTGLADIQFAGYRLEILENAGGQDGGPFEYVRVVPSEQAASVNAPAHTETFKSPIEVEVLPKSQTVEKGETAAFQLAITNAAWRVGAFQVVVEIKEKVGAGLDAEKEGNQPVAKKDQPQWAVDIDIRDQFTGERESGEVTPQIDSSHTDTWGFTSTAWLRLNERESATVEISIIPEPDLNDNPDSHIAAGDYNVTFRVESPDYGSSAEDSVTLKVEPFYEFTCELSPSIANASWWQAATHIDINLTNQGNSTASYRLEGQDNENGLKLGFLSQEQERAESVTGRADNRLLNRALARKQERKIQEVKVEPENLEKANNEQDPPVRLFIRPLRRPLVRFSPRQYLYSITVTSEDDESQIKPLYGIYRQAPLVGPVGILLLIALLALTIASVYFFVQSEIVIKINKISLTCEPIKDKPNNFSCDWATFPENENIQYDFNSVSKEAKIKRLDQTETAKPTPGVAKTVEPTPGVAKTGKAEIEIFKNELLTLDTYYKLFSFQLFKKTSGTYQALFKKKLNVKIDIETVNVDRTIDPTKLSQVMIGEEVTVTYKIEADREEEDGKVPDITGDIYVKIGPEISEPCKPQGPSCKLRVSKVGDNNTIRLSYLGSDYYEPKESSLYKDTISVIRRPVEIETDTVEVGILEKDNILPGTRPFAGQQNVAMKVYVRSDFYNYMGSDAKLKKGNVILRIGTITQEGSRLFGVSKGRYAATFENFPIKAGKNDYILEYKPDSDTDEEDVFEGDRIENTFEVTKVNASIECFHHYPGREVPSSKDICDAEQKDGTYFPGMPITIRFRIKPPEGAQVTPPDSFTIYTASGENKKKIDSCRSTEGNKDNSRDVTCTFIPIQPFTDIEQGIIPYRISIKMEGDRNFESVEAFQEIRLQPFTTKLTFVNPESFVSPFQGLNNKVTFKIKLESDDGIQNWFGQGWLEQAYVQFFKGDQPVCQEAELNKDPSSSQITASCEIPFPAAGEFQIKAKFTSGNNFIKNSEEVTKNYQVQNIPTETLLSVRNVDSSETSSKVTFTATVKAVPQNGNGSKDVSSGKVTLHVDDASGNPVQPIEGPKSLSNSNETYKADFTPTLKPGVYQIWAEYTDDLGNFSVSSSDEKKQFTIVSSNSEIFPPPRTKSQKCNGEAPTVEIPKDRAFNFVATIRLKEPIPSGLTVDGTVKFSFMGGSKPITCASGTPDPNNNSAGTSIFTVQVDQGSSNNIGTATCQVKINDGNPTNNARFNVIVSYKGMTTSDGSVILLPSETGSVNIGICNLDK